MPILKILVSGVLIWLSSEIGKRSGKLGGLILSLPLTSIIAISWLWFETKDTTKVSSLATETLVFILPSLVLFFALPVLISRSVPFILAMGISIVITLVAYALFFKLRGI